jgi:hypothetical protein
VLLLLHTGCVAGVFQEQRLLACFPARVLLLPLQPLSQVDVCGKAVQ